MEGVKILAVGEQVIYGGFNWVSACIMFFIVLIMGSLIFTLDEELDMPSAFIILLMSLGVGIAIGFYDHPEIGSIPAYTVTIEDTVNFNDFTEKYEIIEQDGKIYTVKEREEN